MKSKGLTKFLSSFLLLFYVAIIMMAFFPVLHIDALKNFVSALIFEIIGIILLAYFILGTICTEEKKIGFIVPLIICTIVYTVLLDIMNLALVATMPGALFILTNMILLFVYCLIAIPMFIMGRKETKEEI